MRAVSFLLAILLSVLATAFGSAFTGFQDKTISPGDELSIACKEESTLNKNYTVTKDGLVLMSFIGAVEVKGLTEAQAAKKIADSLVENRILRIATITVKIEKSAAPPTTSLSTVQFTGAVAQSGEVPWKEGMRLKDIIAVAKPLPEADLTNIEIQTAEGDKLVFNYTLATSGDERYNPTMKPGDTVIFARKSGEISQPQGEGTILVLGGVKRPGSVNFAVGMKLRQAIEAAGGLAENADTGNIRLEREGASPQTFDYNRQPDEILIRANDKIVVGVRNEMKAYVFVNGEMRRAGPVEYKTGMTLTQALTAAGGPKSNKAQLDKVTITRHTGLKDEVQTVNAKQIIQGYAGDITLTAGDRIEVPKVNGRDNQMLKIAGAALLLFFLIGR